MVETGLFGIHPYGILVGLGILAGFWVAARIALKFKVQSSKFKITDDDVRDALWWAVIPGMIGARLYHVIDLWSYYRGHLLLIPAVWTGGMGIFGAITGGVLGLWLYCVWRCGEELVASADRNFLARKGSIPKSSDISKGQPGRVPGLSELRKFVSLAQLLIARAAISGRISLPEKMSALFSSCVMRKFLFFSDLAAFGLPIGQAVGRWGNFFNQELYGLPTDLPWGLAIPTEKRLSGFGQYTYFHPLFLYESLWSLLTFGVLLLVFRLRGSLLKSGSYFSMYLMLYGVGRLFLEGLRISPWMISSINIAQAMGILFIVSGGVLLYSKSRK